MTTLHATKNSGFTVIELMIVLIIVGILLALAYPSYINYVRKANRGEAQQLLLNWSINQEIWRSNHIDYNGVTDPDSDDYIMPADTDKYDFTVAADATTYTLTATPKGDQAKDESPGEIPTPCNPLTLNQNGQKLPAACWE